MSPPEERAHGVTPGLRQDYANRTARKQAAFALPYLRPGMDLLDAGCGPGTITMGLARVVSPGRVTGLDHDREHIEEARGLAAEAGMGNVAFEVGDVLSLPFEDNTLDAAFENDLFTHLGERAEAATREILRALKPGGVFAARDVDAGAVVWGHPIEPLKMLDELFIAWHKSRGSDITFGKRLPRVLREAGFANIVKSVSADTKGNPGAVRAHADITVSLLDGPFGGDIVEEGWGDRRTVERLKAGIQEWAAHPDAFFANVHVEVVGWKPEPNAQGTS